MNPKVKEAKIIRYFNALKNLKELLDTTDKVSLSRFADTHKVSNQFSAALKKAGIIKNTGSSGKGARWIWSSIEPNRDMAIRTIDELGNPFKRNNITIENTENNLKSFQNSKKITLIKKIINIRNPRMFIGDAKVNEILHCINLVEQKGDQVTLCEILKNEPRLVQKADL